MAEYYSGGFSVFDRANGKVFFCGTMVEVTRVTGVSTKTVQRVLKKNEQELSKSGFLVKHFGDETPWINGALNKVVDAKGKVEYVSHLRKRVYCMDIGTREITLYAKGIREAASAKGLTYKQVYQSIMAKDHPGVVCDKWVFRFDLAAMPTDEALRKRLLTVYGRDAHVQLKVLPYGLVVKYPSALACARATGLCEEHVKLVVKRREQVTSEPHYLLKSGCDKTAWVV